MHAYPSVIATSAKMVRAAPLLSLPIVITEQNPSRLGKTVPLPQSALDEVEKAGNLFIIEKTKFSMMVGGVEEKLREWGVESIIIFGIEVRTSVLLSRIGMSGKGRGRILMKKNDDRIVARLRSPNVSRPSRFGILGSYLSRRSLVL